MMRKKQRNLPLSAFALAKDKTVQSFKNFLAKYLSKILGWAVITGVIMLLWIFKEQLSGLASVLWPIIVGTTIIGFRRELSDLLKRLKRFSKEGLEFEENRISAQMLAKPLEETLKEIAPGEFRASYITARVTSLKGELDRRELDDNVRRESLLMLRLAEAQQMRDFQNAWLNIFGSQIEALLKMAAENSAVDLIPYHETHVKRAESMSTTERPVESLSFGIWSSYFPRMQLATINHNSGTITDAGRGLLEAVHQQNYPRFQLL